MGHTLAVASDHAARTGLVLEFYARVLPPGKRLVVIDENATSRPPDPPSGSSRTGSSRTSGPVTRAPTP